LVLISGCSLFGDDEEDEPPVPSTLVIANGGNFGDQNGYLTLYDPESEQTTDLQDLGAFAQAVLVRNGNAYVVLNTFTAGRIDVVDLASGQVVQQIPVPAPRGIAFLDNDELLATNLSSFGENGPEPGVVSSVRLSSEEVSDLAAAGLYPEGVAVTGETAWIANSGSLGSGTTLSSIDTESGTESKVELGCDGPNEVFVDADGQVAVVCEGKVVYNDDFTQILESTNGQVVFVDPSTSTVIGRIELDFRPGSANGAQSAYYDDVSGELYVISDTDGTVARISTDRNALDAVLDVPDQEGLTGLAAVAYDGTTRQLYLARLALGPGGFPDFSASGAVAVLDRD
jgi:hypothetical protein